ncbi:MAG: Cof-type HAD-IIB family hydrolase [Clostridiales Family XIII bacterium]|jgi:Cof subfamily protein (haloacid dehalogenase superfamily)|nr:Cof-type HAD-IIB family hydrolase [Clostridiales Family XIII bacterium]
MTIKLIASDLDGTLLAPGMVLSKENRTQIERCLSQGIVFVPATGRSRTSVPAEIRAITGIKYLITSNGAAIVDNVTDEIILSRFLSEEAVRSIWELISDTSIMKEVFWKGTAYIAWEAYDNPLRFGVPERSLAYVRTTRRPVSDIAEFTEAHIHELENINFNFPSEEVQAKIRRALVGNEEKFSITSSLAHNFEIGPKDSDKGAAVRYLTEKFGFCRDEVMCIGDNENDASMVSYGGVGVAMENGAAETKAVADYVAPPNYEDGVAVAIKKYIK